MERYAIRSFLAHGHPYRLYVYESVAGVPPGTQLLDAEAILPRERIFRDESGSLGAFSDWFRFELLLEHGGYWVDMDVVCLRPLPDDPDFVLASQRRPHWQPPRVASAVIRVPAGSEIMQHASEEAVRRARPGLRWASLGPPLLGELVWELGLTQYVRPPADFCPINWWQWRRLLSGSLLVRWQNHLSGLGRAYVVHLWNELWRRSGTDRDGHFPSRSLYERLRREHG